MGRQVGIRVRGISDECRHPARSQQPIVNGHGNRIADRCGLCQRIVQWRKCAGCDSNFRVAESSLRRGRKYHDARCRSRASCQRRKLRASQQNTDGN